MEVVWLTGVYETKTTLSETYPPRGGGGGGGYSLIWAQQVDRQTDMFLFGVLYKESTLTTIPNR